ncbi:hypothetical protein HAX54_046882 [Datura stramonium]|uniref:Uncharacterized protein n=1 Tax=Datura stramonium TaxID=4076 RepID=A0ABS8SS63_DATST|nr:hypothetical protein [Datura stramonium]
MGQGLVIASVLVAGPSSRRSVPIEYMENLSIWRSNVELPERMQNAGATAPDQLLTGVFLLATGELPASRRFSHQFTY